MDQSHSILREPDADALASRLKGVALARVAVAPGVSDDKSGQYRGRLLHTVAQ